MERNFDCNKLINSIKYHLFSNMICDVNDLCEYWYYKNKTGRFVITFYKEDSDGTNYTLYKYLKSLEREFNDVPILRFEYDQFIKYYPLQNVPSPIHLLIVGNKQENELIEATDLSCIRKVLEKVKEMRFLNRKKS